MTYRRERDTDTFQILLVANAFFGPVLSIIKLALFYLIFYIFKSYAWLRCLVYVGALTNLLFYFSASAALIALCAPRDGLDYVAAFRVSSLAESFMGTNVPMIQQLCFFSHVRGVRGLISCISRRLAARRL